MYLSQLSNEEKPIFFGLAYHLACADGNYSDDEKAVIEAYCQEMNIDFDEKVVTKPVEELIADLKNSSNEKIFLFELIGLAMSDGNYDDKEKELILQIQSTIGVDKQFVAECEKVLAEYLDIQNRINNLVIE